MSEPLFVLLMLGALAARVAAARRGRRRRRGRPRGAHARQRADPARSARVRSCGHRAGRSARPRCWSRSRCWWWRRGRSATRSSCTRSCRSRPSSARRWPAPTTTRRAPTATTPASWRSVRGVAEYLPLTEPWRTTPEVVIERRLRAASLDFIREHPGYLGDRRLLEHAPPARPVLLALVASHGGDDQREPGWADAGVDLLLDRGRARAGRRGAGARAIPWIVWAVPLVMYLSVVFLAAETPRYRAPIDPFVILLAALALAARRRGSPASGPAGAPDQVPCSSCACGCGAGFAAGVPSRLNWSSRTSRSWPLTPLNVPPSVPPTSAPLSYT